MEIKQIQVGYNDAQDRMVLRINIDDDKFANLVLTRRVCRFMLDQISPYLKITEPGPEPSVGSKEPKSGKRARKKLSEQTIAVVADNLGPARASEENGIGKSVEAPAKPDYKTPFEDRNPEGNIFGIGSACPVVVNAGCSTQDDKLCFTLQFENQQTMNLSLSQLLAKGIFRLMYDLAERIQWFGGIAPTHVSHASEADVNEAPVARSSVTYH